MDNPKTRKIEDDLKNLPDNYQIPDSQYPVHP